MQSALLRSAGSLRWRTEYELRRRPIGCGVRHGGLAWHSAAWQSRHGMWHATYEMQHAIYICTHLHKQNIARKMILPQERERLDEEKVQLQLRYSPILYYSSLYCLVAKPKVPCRAMRCRSAALAPQFGRTVRAYVAVGSAGGRKLHSLDPVDRTVVMDGSPRETCNIDRTACNSGVHVVSHTAGNAQHSVVQPLVHFLL